MEAVVTLSPQIVESWGKGGRIVCKILLCLQGPPLSVRLILGLRKWCSPQIASESGWFLTFPLQNLLALLLNVCSLLNDPGGTAPLG